MRDSAVIYRSFYEAMEGLETHVKASLWEAICELSFNMKEVELTGVAKNIFRLIKPQIEANIKRYENGLKPKDKQRRSKEESSDKQEESKPLTNDNDNVSVSENVHVSENVSNDNRNEIIDHFNKVTNSKSKGTKEVLANIEFLLKTYSVDEIKKVIDFIANDTWYIENKYVTLSTIFKRTKFNDKFERANCALVAKQKPSYHTIGDFTGQISGDVDF